MGCSRFLITMLEIEILERIWRGMRLPRAMHGDPCGSAIGIELDIERSHMGSESESRSDAVVAAERVIKSRVLVSDSKLLARHATVVWDLRDVPGSEDGYP
jgi:hypothetical protein